MSPTLYTPVGTLEPAASRWECRISSIVAGVARITPEGEGAASLPSNSTRDAGRCPAPESVRTA